MDKPVLLYDEDCGFCQHWVRKWHIITGEKIIYKPYQEALDDFPQFTKKQCENAVQLIMPDGAHFSAAHAVFKLFSLSGKHGFLLKFYKKMFLFRLFSELFYRFVASKRSWLSRIYSTTSCKIKV